MNGKQHGQGTETLSDGSKYVGKWMQGFAHGQGIETSSDGSKREGEWGNGWLYGRGIETFPDGSKYEGEWKKSRKTIGIMTYSNGEKYLVEFEYGLEFKRTKCDKDGKIIKKKDVSMANAEEVKLNTGFSIGGVAPVAHLKKLNILIDESLGRFQHVFGAAGHPNSIFKIGYNQLVEMTKGRVKEIVE